MARKPQLYHCQKNSHYFFHLNRHFCLRANDIARNRSRVILSRACVDIEETYVRSQTLSSESAVEYPHIGRGKIQISPPLGEQDQSNAPTHFASSGVHALVQIENTTRRDSGRV